MLAGAVAAGGDWHGAAVSQYRKTLQRRYQTILAALGKPDARQERDDHEAH